jgi:hypothetical protein
MDAPASTANRRRWKQRSTVMVVVVAITTLVAIGIARSQDGDTVQAETAQTPTAQAGSPLAAPSPDADGIYHDLTVEQAKRVVPFDLVMPDVLPENLAASLITVEESDRIEGLVTRPDEKMYVVTTTYGPANARTHEAIRYIQSNRIMETPPWGEMSEVELGGKAINKAIMESAGEPTVAIYWWQADGIHARVVTEMESDSMIDIVEQLVAAIQTARPTR